MAIARRRHRPARPPDAASVWELAGNRLGRLFAGSPTSYGATLQMREGGRATRRDMGVKSSGVGRVRILLRAHVWGWGGAASCRARSPLQVVGLGFCLVRQS